MICLASTCVNPPSSDEYDIGSLHYIRLNASYARIRICNKAQCIIIMLESVHAEKRVQFSAKTRQPTAHAHRLTPPLTRGNSCCIPVQMIIFSIFLAFMSLSLSWANQLRIKLLVVSAWTTKLSLESLHNNVEIRITDRHLSG